MSPPAGVTAHTVDVTVGAAVAALVAAIAPAVVYHAAGVVAYHPAGRAAMEAVNVGGTLAVVEAVAAASTTVANGGDGSVPPPLPPPRLVHLSSVAALGSLASPADARLTEATAAAGGGSGAWRPAADGAVGYLATKRAAAGVVVAAATTGRLPDGAILACPTTVYGYGDAAKASRGTVARAAAERWPLYTSGGVNVVAIDAVLGALVEAADVALPAGGRAVPFILGGVNVTIHQLLTAFAAAGGSRGGTLVRVGLG